MAWKSRKAKTKTRKIKPKDYRKAEFQKELIEAGRALTPPAKKLPDILPTKPVILLCRLCALHKDCEAQSPKITDCQDFTRKLVKRVILAIPTAPRPIIDLSHINRKFQALCNYHDSLVAKWQTAKKEVARLEIEMNEIEAQMSKAIVVKTHCPNHLPANEFFRSNHEKAAVKADPWKPEPAKVAKVRKAEPKTAKVDLAKLNLMDADF